MKHYFLLISLFNFVAVFAQSPVGKYRILDIYLSNIDPFEESETMAIQSFASKEVDGVVVVVSSDSLKYYRHNQMINASALHSIADNRIEYYNKQMQLNTMDFKRRSNGQFLLIGKNDTAYLCEKME